MSGAREATGAADASRSRLARCALRGCAVLAMGAIGVMLAGCAAEGILELELELPPQPAGSPPLYAVVEANAVETFDRAWSRGGRLPGIPLAASCDRAEPAPDCDERELDERCSAVVSVVSGAELERPLRVRVRFCEDAGCAAPADAAAVEHRLAIERAFYPGRYTAARTCVDAVPTTTDPSAETIDRCEVRCVDEEAGAGGCREDGTHACE